MKQQLPPAAAAAMIGLVVIVVGAMGYYMLAGKGEVSQGEIKEANQKIAEQYKKNPPGPPSNASPGGSPRVGR